VLVLLLEGKASDYHKLSQTQLLLQRILCCYSNSYGLRHSVHVAMHAPTQRSSFSAPDSAASGH
jgi:hypothetical protein